MNKIKIASLQFMVQQDKYENIEKLAEILAGGEADGADFISLPEMWNCPYVTELFPEYAELEGEGDTWLAMSTLARKHKVYLIGGSIPECDSEGRVYNTNYVFDREGRQIGKHRKVHLFDIFAHGQQVFKESDTLTGGDNFTVFDTEFCKMAVNLCFDIRFPESSRLPALAGARVIFNPAAFNMTTGPVHWELGFRQRAVENQIYMVGTSTARNPEASYQAWGHSIITDPWGTVVMQMDEKAGVNVTEIDLDYIDEIRAKLPLMSARRTDVYELKEVKENTNLLRENVLDDIIQLEKAEMFSQTRYLHHAAERRKGMATNKSGMRPGMSGGKPNADLGQALLAVIGIGLAGGIALVGGAVKLGEKMLDLQVKAYEKIESEREAHRELVRQATANELEFGVDPDASEEEEK